MSGFEKHTINLTEKEFIEVGKRISACRREAGMTLDDVGRMLGLHRSSILRYENGHTKQIKLVILERIAQIFNTTPEYLMTGSDEPNRKTSDATKSENAATAPVESTEETKTYIHSEEESTQQEAADEKNLPVYDPPTGLSFGNNTNRNNKLRVASPCKYNAHVPPPVVYTDHEIVSSFIENTLPHIFAYTNYCRDFVPRIIPGDILTIRVTDQSESGDLCLFMTQQRTLVIRRIFHSRIGIVLVADNPEIIPEMLPCLGRNTGYNMIGRITHLNATM